MSKLIIFGEVIQAGYAMKLEEQKRGREPDLVFVSRGNLERLTHNYLDGAADIAVEIVLPESFERDTQTKFVEYEAAGISEYWLIDPEQQKADFYRLDENGFYNPVQILDGIFYSEVLEGFFLKIEWLWQNPSPTRDAFQELNLI